MDDGSLGEFLASHPEVSVPPPVDGTWHAEVALDCGWGYVHGADEAELLAKLAAALGGLRRCQPLELGDDAQVYPGPVRVPVH